MFYSQDDCLSNEPRVKEPELGATQMTTALPLAVVGIVGLPVGKDDSSPE